MSKKFSTITDQMVPSHAPTDAPWAHVAKPGPYLTILDPKNEALFQSWVKQNNVPFDPSPKADYDMRGFFKGLLEHHPQAISGINPTDNQIHYSDYWKTPYHESFSRESQYALPSAPMWLNDYQLIDSNGKVVFDERSKRAR